MTPFVVGFHVKAFVRSRQRQASSAQHNGSHCWSPDKAPERESLHESRKQHLSPSLPPLEQKNMIAVNRVLSLPQPATE